MHEAEDEPAETFNQDQQEMFQHPGTNLGETRPRTPGTESIAPLSPPANDEEASGAPGKRKLDNPNLI
jgi:hypothetical protein